MHFFPSRSSFPDLHNGELKIDFNICYFVYLVS